MLEDRNWAGVSVDKFSINSNASITHWCNMLKQVPRSSRQWNSWMQMGLHRTRVRFSTKNTTVLLKTISFFIDFRFDYQILAGPVFIGIYTFAAIPVGIAADVYNRKVKFDLLSFYKMHFCISNSTWNHWVRILWMKGQLYVHDRKSWNVNVNARVGHKMRQGFSSDSTKQNLCANFYKLMLIPPSWNSTLYMSLPTKHWWTNQS